MSALWHPFTQMKPFEAGEQSFPMVERALGGALTLADGRTLIDGVSSWWVITHGHCEPSIVAAIQEQVSVLDQVIFAGFTHPKAERLGELMVGLTPDPLTRVFFSDDGSTAVEVALKMAIQATRQRGEAHRNRFLAFSHAYHGDTVGAMSVGGPSVFTDAFRDMMFQVAHVSQPTRSDAPLEAWIGPFHEALAEHGDHLAGVIIEPLVQGAGGMIMWPEDAVREIVATCRERGILVIFDEVMTGFGRTGATFAMTKLGVTPDLAAFSKGLTGGMLPLSITMATDEIYGAFLSDDRAKTFFHGHSFTANPVSCAAAVANIELIHQKDMAGEWARIEALHRERIASLRHPELIDDARICGTIAAVEIKNPKAADYLAPTGPIMYKAAQDAGVLLRPLGNVLYILPPYCLTDAQLHQCWDAVEAAMEAVLKA